MSCPTEEMEINLAKAVPARARRDPSDDHFQAYRVCSMPPPLSAHTTLRLGGEAEIWIDARSEVELIDAVTSCRTELFILGGGSNIVVADGGVPGTLVRVLTRGIEHRRQGDAVLVRVAAGEPWDELVAQTVGEDLAGLECMSGIPGTAGAAPIQNVSAYGGVLRNVLSSVRVLDRDRDEIVEFGRDDCGFGYRTSRFKVEDGRFVVLSVELRLLRQRTSLPIEHEELAEALEVPVAETAPLAKVHETVLALRAKRGMVLDPEDLDTRSTGSFFINPLVGAEELADVKRRAAKRLGPGTEVRYDLDADGNAKLHAAWLIERAGHPKGYGNPKGIAISSKHCLALSNRGKGSTAELVSLAEEITASVKEVWGITLEPEPVFVGHDWQPLLTS
jgi:UDP-N-acetylmuramate dehydrogenase